MTPRGVSFLDLGPKNSNFSTIEFRAEPPVFFIYILVVHEEYIINSSKSNIQKIARVRDPHWFLGVIFWIPQKVPLGSTARAHFLWDPPWITPAVTRQTLPFRL